MINISYADKNFVFKAIDKIVFINLLIIVVVINRQLLKILSKSFFISLLLLMNCKVFIQFNISLSFNFKSFILVYVVSCLKINKISLASTIYYFFNFIVIIMIIISSIGCNQHESLTQVILDCAD